MPRIPLFRIICSIAIEGPEEDQAQTAEASDEIRPFRKAAAPCGRSGVRASDPSCTITLSPSITMTITGLTWPVTGTVSPLCLQVQGVMQSLSTPTLTYVSNPAVAKAQSDGSWNLTFGSPIQPLKPGQYSVLFTDPTGYANTIHLLVTVQGPYSYSSP